MHLTIQEFLAAEALLQKPADVQTKFVFEHLNELRFRPMLRFVFGKAQLDDIEEVITFLYATASSAIDNSRFLFLCHMLYEAQDTQATKAIGLRNQPPCIAKLTLGSNINLFDAMVVGRFLSITSVPIKSFFMNYYGSISCQLLKLLTNSLSQDCTDASIEELYLETRGCTYSEIAPFLLHPVFQATRYLEIDLCNVPEIASVICLTIVKMPSLTGLSVHFRGPTIADGILTNPQENAKLAIQKLFEAITQYPKITFLKVSALGNKKPELLDEKCSMALGNMIETRESPFSLHFCLSLYSRPFIEDFSKYIAVSTKIKELQFRQNFKRGGRITAGETKLLFNALKTNTSLEFFRVS